MKVQELVASRSGQITRVSAFVLRAPTPHPVRTSFGVMHDRPAVLVRIEDESGTCGWGEVWCNFPACGAEHRARLIETVFRPLLEGSVVTDPAAASAALARKTHILSIQSGEPGPFAQVLAGLDVALWDLAGRRAGQPLWRLLGGTGVARVPVYASGINPDDAGATVAARRAAGFRAFKLKIGFDAQQDVENLRAIRALAGPNTPVMVDANQAWSVKEAIEMSRRLAPFDPVWLEEPIAADRPLSEWRALAEASSIPLAAGENARGLEQFDALADAGVAVIQPDLAKWGGITGCVAVARQTLARGRRFCPHFLGAGLGLLASAHLLKAVGGDGLLEVDVNDNPLQSQLTAPFPAIADGAVSLPDGPGLGVTPDAAALSRYRVAA
jgi:D-galactarolactone cycloisomerase